MGIFTDKKYEDMDDLSRLCEPILDPLNDILNLLPDEFELPIEYIINGAKCGDEPRSITIDEVIKAMYSKCNIDVKSWYDREKIGACFELKLKVDDKCAFLNIEEGTLTGVSIKLVKIKKMFEEKEAEAQLGLETVKEIRRISVYRVETGRINEILELMGLNEVRRMRSIRQKILGLATEMSEIMKENRWKIKDVVLSNKIGLWIARYIEDGNLAALTNFCKLKVMTHEDKPIYSIEEEKL